MNNIRLLLKYIAPYKGSAIKNILYNILSAVFALFTFTLIKPFLTVLFGRVGIVANPGPFQLNSEYIKTFTNYLLSVFIDKYGQAGALLLAVMVVTIASLFKNGFIFLANNCMAMIRSSTVRDLRKMLYNKILRFSLLAVMVVTIASLFKNGFIFLANNCMAMIRSSTVRDLRKMLYNKILR